MTRSLRLFLCTIAVFYCISPAPAQTLIGPIALAPVAVESDSPLAAIRWALDAATIAGTHDTVPTTTPSDDTDQNADASSDCESDCPEARLADASHSIEPPELDLVDSPTLIDNAEPSKKTTVAETEVIASPVAGAESQLEHSEVVDNDSVARTEAGTDDTAADSADSNHSRIDEALAAAADEQVDLLDEEYLPYDVKDNSVVRINVFPAKVREPKTFVVLLPVEEPDSEEGVQPQAVAVAEDDTSGLNADLAQDAPVAEHDTDLSREKSIAKEAESVTVTDLANGQPESEGVTPNESIVDSKTDAHAETPPATANNDQSIETETADSHVLADTATETCDELCPNVEFGEEKTAASELPAEISSTENEVPELAIAQRDEVAEEFAAELTASEIDEAATMAADLALIEELFGPDPHESAETLVNDSEAPVIAGDEKVQQDDAATERYAAFEALFGPDPTDETDATNPAEVTEAVQSGEHADIVVEAESIINADEIVGSEIFAETESLHDTEPAHEAPSVLHAEPIVEAGEVAEATPVAEADAIAKVESSTESEPILEAEAVAEVEAVVEAEAVTESEPIVEAEAVAKVEPSVGAEPSFEVEAIVEAGEVAEATSVAEAGDIAKVESSTESEPIFEAEAVVEAGEVADSTPVAEAGAIAKVESSTESEPVLEADAVVEAEAVAEATPVGDADVIAKAEPVVEIDAIAQTEPSVEAKSVIGADPIEEAVAIVEAKPVDEAIIRLDEVGSETGVEATKSVDPDPRAEVSESSAKTTPSEIAAIGPREDLRLDDAVEADDDEGIQLPIDPDALGKRILEGLIHASELLHSVAKPVVVAEPTDGESITRADEESLLEEATARTPVASGDVIASLPVEIEAELIEANSKTEVAAVPSEADQLPVGR